MCPCRNLRIEMTLLMKVDEFNFIQQLDYQLRRPVSRAGQQALNSSCQHEVYSSRHLKLESSITNVFLILLHFKALLLILLCFMCCIRQECNTSYFGQCSARRIQWQLDICDRQHHLYVECCTFIGIKLRRKIGSSIDRDAEIISFRAYQA